MTKIKNSTVLITGGANGIGKLMAEGCFKEKASKVVIWDINETNLLKTAAEFQKKGFDVHPYIVDVGSSRDINSTAKKVLKDVGPVDILINNAGIVVGKPFAEHSDRDIQKTLDINVAGVMRVARAFLPTMIERKKGHIVNIASAAGFIPNPNMSVYAASKWAVIGWSESLRLEMEAMKGRLHVTTVTPSYINTGMFDGVKAPLLTPMLEPDYIAGKVIKAIKKNTIFLQEPMMVKSIPALRGILPTRVFDFVAGNVFGVYKTMDKFTGRAPKEAASEKKSLTAKKK